MRYALNEEKKRIEVKVSGQRARCGICNSEVIGKKGKINKKHWAHKRNKDCDNWFEPISDWHLAWQNYFPKQNREIIITENGKSHRADIQLDNGMVIEVQNSPIDLQSIFFREEFYGKKNMIWILNGKTLAIHSEVKIQKYPFRYFFIIEFPYSLPNNTNYLTKEFFDQVVEFYGLHYLESIRYTSNKIICSSLEDIRKNDQLELTHIKYFIVTVYEILYGNLDIEVFRKELKLINDIQEVNSKKYTLKKRYWRQFIDKINFPVFIDQLNGLEEDEIFYYQKNRSYKKEELIKKYLVHTKNINNN